MVNGHSVYFSPFWYVAPRKIWQPSTAYIMLFKMNKNVIFQISSAMIRTASMQVPGCHRFSSTKLKWALLKRLTVSSSGNAAKLRHTQAYSCIFIYLGYGAVGVCSAHLTYILRYCGNNGEGDQVDNLYSLRVKSTLTEHKLKHLHLYQINGRSRLGKKRSRSDPSRNKNIKQFYVKQKIGGKIRNGGKISGTKNNAKHDQIIQYFLQYLCSLACDTIL
jgi:hypothetical protein